MVHGGDERQIVWITGGLFINLHKLSY